MVQAGNYDLYTINAMKFEHIMSTFVLLLVGGFYVMVIAMENR